MSGGIDWSAVADALGKVGSAAAAGQKIGKSMPGYQQPVTRPADDYTVFKTSADMADTAPGTAGYKAGQGLLGPLKLPSGISAASKFTWSIDSTPGSGKSTLTQMTLAGSLSWLRDLAAHNSQQYDEIVAGLVRANYLNPGQAKYGSYTSAVATAFLQSAIDVEQANNDQGTGGSVKTWWNHIDDLYQGRINSGQINADGSTGSGGGGSAAPTPTRTDVFTNPEDVKAAINNAARSVLGRHLTDAESAQFASAFHGTEQTYNNQAWGQQLASANNAASAPAAVRPPSVSDAAQNYVDSSPALAADRTKQLLGSYIGVLRSMTGLGAGGVSSAVS